MRQKAWSPHVVGAGIGILSWFAFATADHPIGITTAFEHSAALVIQAVVQDITSNYVYYQNTENTPVIGWEWMLVIGVLVGAAWSAYFSGDHTREVDSELWQWRFGPSIPVRLTAAFLGGVLMMIGARLAKGCTSGHGISGILQLAVSSWIFVMVIFSVWALTAFFLFGKKGRNHV